MINSWAYAVVAAFESFNLIYNGYSVNLNPVLFSEENMVNSIGIGSCTVGSPGKLNEIISINMLKQSIKKIEAGVTRLTRLSKI